MAAVTLDHQHVAPATPPTRTDAHPDRAATASVNVRRTPLAWVVLAGILVCGGALRVANLGGPDFGVDETFHVYAAQRLNAGDPPLLPSGQPYARSLPYTHLVAWSGLLFGGVNEWTARFPSVVFGCLAIILVFVMGRRWYSDSAAIVAAAITALAPMQIAFSRQVRMYAVFQCLYLLVIFLLFEAFEATPSARGRWTPEWVASWQRKLQVRPALLLVAAPLVLLTYQVHDLILPSVSGPAAYILCMAAIGWSMRGLEPQTRLKYYVASVAVLIAVLLCIGLNIGSARDLMNHARTYAPAWAQESVGHWRYYIYGFAEIYPMIFATFLLSSLFALTQNARATIYILACFALPFLLHSFMFAWKEERYLFHTMPLMFIVFAVGVTELVRAFYRQMSAWANEALVLPPRVVAAALTAAAIGFSFAATKELREGVKLHTWDVGMFAGVQHFNWAKAMAFIGRQARAGDVIITSRSLASRYYGPDLPMYYLNHQELDSILSSNPRDRNGMPLDNSTGAPIILDVSMLEDVVKRHATGWFVTERRQFSSRASIPQEIARYIDRQFRLVPVPDADDMVVYRWERPPASEMNSGSAASSENALSHR